MTAAWEREAQPLLGFAHPSGLDAWPEELSRGTRQKVALSAALGLALFPHLPEEPFATLDGRSRERYGLNTLKSVVVNLIWTSSKLDFGH